MDRPGADGNPSGSARLPSPGPETPTRAGAPARTPPPTGHEPGRTSRLARARGRTTTGLRAVRHRTENPVKDNARPAGPAQPTAVAAAPALTSAIPNTGPAAGGNNVILTGSGFTGITAVRFGANPALGYTVNSSTQITAVAPAGTGAVAVTVTAPGGTSNAVTYTYAVVPVLTSVSPSGGPASGGTTVVLTGTDLGGATAVRFGSTAATSFTVNSSTQITAVAPAGTGAVPVTVTTPGGTSNAVTYTYTVVPVLTSVSPSQGPASGGTTVVLTGTDLGGATAVSFGSTAATSFTVNSSTQITAVAPAGSGAVPVTVTTPGGTTGPVYFFYLNVPFLISVSPSGGPASGGTTVVLTGTDLSGATAVRFGSTAATSFTVNSPTQITAVAPAGTGAVPVTVTTPGGTSNSVIYTYVGTPVLSLLSPAQGPTDAGSGVTLSGTGLTTTTAVHFGAASAAFTVLSDTAIAALAPAGTPGPVPVNVTTPGGTSNSLTYTRLAPPVI
ncbi:IPT/TIG domain-containing protein [Streptomyces sp. NPDC088354]|uniref:IPT/TIG domain-containing protein n=1 Tax=Streptomyces sp. NPDC088354 TaxID=3365856 RepID=UPI0037FDE103